MRPVSITVFDAETGTSTDYSFTTSPVRIGRNPLNDLSLPFPFVSGWHAVVRFDDEVAKFFDLGSTNGTVLNGRRVVAGEPVFITEALSLTIGKLELQFRRPPVGAQAPGPPSPVAGPSPPMSAAPVAPMLHQPTRALEVAAASGTIDPDHRPSPTGGGVPEGTAHVQMSDVHQTVHRLRARYDAYREAWQALSQDLGQSVASMPVAEQSFALSIFQREFPEISGEEEFLALARRVGTAVPSRGGGDAGGDTGAAVRRLAESLRPGEEPPRSAQEAERFLSCVEDVLRASAKAFVELQRGQEQFGNEMGVRTIKEFTALHAAGTPENVLKYLLDWQAGGPHRTQELVGVYADLMIHQVALINGVMEGVRAILARLAPEEVERGVTAGWPTRAAAVWKAYVERYRRLALEDKKLTEVVFGPEFARAYAEVGGEGG